jgi:hypothetical protein
VGILPDSEPVDEASMKLQAARLDARRRPGLGAALLLALLLAAPAPAADPGELDCPRGTEAKGGSPPRAR